MTLQNRVVLSLVRFCLYPFVTYLDFENCVKALTGKKHYAHYRYVLPAIHIIFRERFLATLQAGFNIHESFDHIDKGYRLPEKNYMRYLNYLTTKRTATTQESKAYNIPSLDVLIEPVRN